MGTLLEMSLRDLADIRESLQEETEAFRHVVLGVGNSLRELVALSYGQEVGLVKINTDRRLLVACFIRNFSVWHPARRIGSLLALPLLHHKSHLRHRTLRLQLKDSASLLLNSEIAFWTLRLFLKPKAPRLLRQHCPLRRWKLRDAKLRR